MKHFASRPCYILEGQITIDKPATAPSLERKSEPSGSLGQLDDLPLELLHNIFAMLDFKTLSHVQKTCLRGISVVESLPEYRDMVKHAPGALTALGKTQLIRHHSATTLHSALLCSDCHCCGEYGAFLHLPTCRRCCYKCLWNHPRNWMMSISEAKACFGVTDHQLKGLHIMRSMPGKYFVRHSVQRQRPIRLVCVEDVKRLAIEEYGDEHLIDGELEGPRISNPDYYHYRWLRAAPLQTPQPATAEYSSPTQCRTNDMYCGMASIAFPHLTTTRSVDLGFVRPFGRRILSRGYGAHMPRS